MIGGRLHWASMQDGGRWYRAEGPEGTYEIERRWDPPVRWALRYRPRGAGAADFTTLPDHDGLASFRAAKEAAEEAERIRKEWLPYLGQQSERRYE